jgi:hypothetical protein
MLSQFYLKELMLSYGTLCDQGTCFILSDANLRIFFKRVFKPTGIIHVVLYLAPRVYVFA